MDTEKIKQIILQELPKILQRDPEIQDFVLRLTRPYFADKVETESRFDRVLEELRRDREEESRRWEEQNQRWEEQNRRWEAQETKWAENQVQINRMLEEIKGLGRRFESTIGALGARWGLYSEQSFRNALKGILEDSFNVQVMNVVEYDDEGEVFGRPDQVELDVIIRDSVLIICEIKSSMSKADMYTFERKAAFYQKRHQRQASRRVVVSPMVDPRARPVAEKLGIEVYSSAESIEPEVFSSPESET